MNSPVAGRRVLMALMGLMIIPALMLQPSIADDLDVYPSVRDVSQVYLHVLLDLGDTDLDIPLCTLGFDCAPPFLSDAAYSHLRAMYSSGEGVTAPGIFRAVLAASLENPRFNDLHLSVQIFNHQDRAIDAAEGARGGATFLLGYRQVAGARADIFSLFDGLPSPGGDETHPVQPREAYLEWLHYIRGDQVLLGTATNGNFGQETPIPNFDADLIMHEHYVSPLTSGQDCSRMYSLMFSQGQASSDADLDSQIALATPLSSSASFEEMLAYLHAGTTDLLPGEGPRVALKRSWFVTSRVRPGGAQAYADGVGVPLMFVDAPLELQEMLTQELSKVITDTGQLGAFAFVEDSYHRGRLLEDVFIPLFQPESDSAWHGNIKKFKLQQVPAISSMADSDTAPFVLLDALGNGALTDTVSNGQSLRFAALSHWTDVASLPPGDGVGIPADVDGAIVPRGGAGQKIDGYAAHAVGGGVSDYLVGDSNTDKSALGYPARQLFFATQAGELEPFDATVESAAALRPLLDPEATLPSEEILDLIRWGRGQTDKTALRSGKRWMLGAVIHSQPLALNYGAVGGYSRGNPNVRLLFGSGDGLFHILENTRSNGAQSGREVFAFYPAETLPNLLHRRSAERPAQQLSYGVDGAAAVLSVDHNRDGNLDHTVGDKAYAYFGLRRGGAAYYALDISDPAAPARLLWHIKSTSGGDFDELGLTFSKPVIARVNYSGEATDVLIFGGGYHGGWNASRTARVGKDLNPRDDPVGNAIYIVNARTGALIWKAVQGVTGESTNLRYSHADLVDSIPSEVAVLTGADGMVHRLYVGDTGGGLWRVDLPSNGDGVANHRRSSWFITKLANLGFDAQERGGSKEDDRRFFHAPDIVRSFDAQGEFEGVVLQSGDRAHPNETGVRNYLFYLRDRQIHSGSQAVRAENSVQHPKGRIPFTELTDISSCATNAILCTGGQGWKRRLKQPGAKGLSSPLVDGGRVFFTSYVPAQKACPQPMGRSRLTVLRLLDGSPVLSTKQYFDIDEGLPKDVRALGDHIYIPGQGVDLGDSDDGVGDQDAVLQKLIPSTAPKYYGTYWRQPGIDPL